MRNNSVNLFCFWTSVSEDVLLRHFLSRAVAVERDHLCIFGRVHHEEQFCGIILNFDQWFRRRCCLKDLLSGALAAFLFGGAEPFMQF